MRSRWTVLVAALAVVATTRGAAPALAQPLWIERSGRPVISLEWAKPVYEQDGVAFTSSVLFLRSWLPAGEHLAVALELPVSHYGEEAGPYSPQVSGTIVANPYVGVEYAASGGIVWGEFGVRIPTVPDEDSENQEEVEAAQFNALVVDVNGLQFAAQDAWIAQAAANAEFVHASGAFVRMRLAPWLALPATELFGNYHLLVGSQFSFLRLTAGLAGLILVTEEELDFSERTIHQMQFMADIGSGRVRPTAYARFWLDERWQDSGLPTSVWGLGVNVRL